MFFAFHVATTLAVIAISIAYFRSDEGLLWVLVLFWAVWAVISARFVFIGVEVFWRWFEGTWIYKTLRFIFYALESIIDTVFWLLVAVVYYRMFDAGSFAQADSLGAQIIIYALPVLFLITPFIRFLVTCWFSFLIFNFNRFYLDVFDEYPMLVENSYLGSVSAFKSYGATNELQFFLMGLIFLLVVIYCLSRFLNIAKEIDDGYFNGSPIRLITITIDKSGIASTFFLFFPLAAFIYTIITYINFTTYIINNGGSILLPCLVFAPVFDSIHNYLFRHNYIPTISKSLPGVLSTFDKKEPI